MATKENELTDSNKENMETRISLLDEKTKLPPKKKYKWITCRKCCVLTVIFVLIGVIGATVFICFADIAKQIRCSISKHVSLSLQECHHLDTLETLSNGRVHSIQNQSVVYMQQHNQNLNLTNCEYLPNGTQHGCPANHTLSAQDMEYISLAESGWDTAWEIFHDLRGWTFDTGDSLSTGRVYHKYYKELGKVSKLVGVMNASPSDLFRILITEEQFIPDWNPIVAQSSILYKVTDSLDISYIATNPIMGGFIASRDYVNLRYWKEVNGSMLVIGVATTHPDKPENDDYVRAYNKPGSGVLIREVKGRPDKCRMEWTLCADFGGWIPQWAVDSAVSTSLIEFFNYAKERVKYVKSQP